MALCSPSPLRETRLGLNDENIVIINGSDEHDLALNKISLKKYTHEVLPGGHHFDGDTEEITNVILNHIN